MKITKMRLSRQGMLLTFVTTLLFARPLLGQVTPFDEVDIASPEAASLGKYTDIPVNYHTGVPDISIPIYTVTEGPLTLPISLSYHASGLKVLETASRVGAGWALNAGGVITRTVNGAPDEKGSTQTHGHFTEKGFNSYVLSQYDAVNPSGTDGGLVRDGIKDGEPDMYSFNFAGYAGKFYFRDDRTVEIVGGQDLHIEPQVNPGERFSRFTITTPDGTKYYFGRTEKANDADPVELTQTVSIQGGQTFNDAISSWYLYKVASANGGYDITLEYEAVEYGFHTLSMFPVSPPQQLGFTNLPSRNPEGYAPIKNIIRGVRLRRIEFTNGEVLFVPSGELREDLNGVVPEVGRNDPNIGNAVGTVDGARALSRIEVWGKSDYCKTFDLSYGYFEDNETDLRGINLVNAVSVVDTDRKRLKLDRVQERTCDGTLALPPYVFTYHGGLVPRRLTLAHDHWGYFNGAVDNDQLIPTYIKDGEEVPGANRDANPNTLQAGSLQRIQYPTGGTTTFELEPNDTWVSMGSSTKEQVLTLTAGADGSSDFVQGSITNTAGQGRSYEIKLRNTGTTDDVAVLEIHKDGARIRSLLVGPDQERTERVFLPGGELVFLLKEENNNSTGDYAEVIVSHWTSEVTNNAITVGGLRVKRITQYDGLDPNNNIVTDYTYTEISSQGISDASSGQLFSRPVYVEVVRNDHKAVIGNAGLSPPLGGEALGCYSAIGSMPYFESPSPIRPMESTQGNHIGYRRVKVAQAGNGYTVYDYYGQTTFTGGTTGDIVERDFTTTTCHPGIPNFPAAPLPHQPIRGKLKRESIFDESGRLVQSKDYTYSFEQEDVGVPGLIVKPFGGGALHTYYELFNHRTTETKVVETTFGDDGIPVRTYSTVRYASDRHPQETSTARTNSKGEWLRTTYKYASDFIGCNNWINALAACDVALAADLQAAGDALPAAIAACQGDYPCERQARLDWEGARRLARVAYLACRESDISSYNSCLAGLPSNIAYELQMAERNPILEIGQFRDDHLLNAQYNEYQRQSGQIHPATVHQLKLTDPSPNFGAATVNGTLMMLDNRYEIETQVKFEQDDLIEIIGRDGIPISYVYDPGLKLPIVKAVGVDHQTLSATLGAVANLEDLRSHPATASGQITTYYYDEPLHGLSSMVDLNGYATYYEYDALGRLIKVIDHEHNVLQQNDYQYNYKTVAE